MVSIALITKYDHAKILKRNIYKEIEIFCFSKVEEMLAYNKDFGFLLTYSISEIISPDLIKRFKNKCFNIHAAHPNYPGRDPHHYASYDSFEYYGAVLHRIDKKVDNGEIINVDIIKVRNHTTPEGYLKVGNSSALKLFDIFLKDIYKSGNIVKKTNKYNWGNKKTKREDLKKLCCLNLNMDKEEIKRRERACNFQNKSNLWIILDKNSYQLININ